MERLQEYQLDWVKIVDFSLIVEFWASLFFPIVYFFLKCTRNMRTKECVEQCWKKNVIDASFWRATDRQEKFPRENFFHRYVLYSIATTPGVSRDNRGVNLNYKPSSSLANLLWNRSSFRKKKICNTYWSIQKKIKSNRR